MVILGASGHAKEILAMIDRDYNYNDISFYDNATSISQYPRLFKKYLHLDNKQKLFERLSSDPDFIVGIGNPNHRYNFWNMAMEANGRPLNLISKNNVISGNDVIFSDGVSIMDLVYISSSVTIGKCALLNCRVNIHHDVSIGNFSEIGPGAMILGKSKIGIKCFIGAGAIIMPKILIGNNAIIGAGAVVTRNVLDNQTVKGIPAK